MTTHTIEIEGLPEGCEIEKIVIAPRNSNDDPMTALAQVKLRKSKPRQIVLEETEEDNRMIPSSHRTYASQRFPGGLVLEDSAKIWRIKEE